MRNIVNINTDWFFSKGELLPPDIPTDFARIDLPHTWNNVDGQDGGNDYYRGTCTYLKRLPHVEGECVFLEIAGAAMRAVVYLNGEKLASHDGGYSAFRVEITDKLLGDDLLCIQVDNSANEEVYPQKADFTFYGGIYRDVNLVVVPKEHFSLSYYGSPGIKATPKVDPAAHTAEITVETWQNADKVEITVNGVTQTAVSFGGHAACTFKMDNVRLWDGLNDPYLYTAAARLDSGDEVIVQFGCRTAAVDAQRGFLLNGREYPLRGVSRHQDRQGKGTAISREDMEEDLSIIQEIGANSIRLAHYQHDQYFYDLCDQAGLVVWAEIPYITKHMDGGNSNTQVMMRELIAQSYHHPSIVCWGLSNEITASGNMTENMYANHLELNRLCHDMDPTRLTSMAHVFMLETDSPMVQIADANAYNLYFGWYLGSLEQNDTFFDEYHHRFPDRPIGFSEYGADANPRFHSKAPDAGDYSEEYQCLYHEHILRLVEARHWLWCTYVWNLFDFAADGRDEGGEHGLNQKGLVSFDRKIRKDAFYLYKAHWSKDPFVHLCGHRYRYRDGEMTQIKVYTNQPNVTLYVDGEEKESRAADKVAEFTIPLAGQHIVRAVAGSCEDTMEIERVETPFEEYRFLKEEIVNWFDQENLDSTCFSIEDTMGEISSHPEASKILAKVMETAHASRGEVAQASGNNANLQRMMGGMKLRELFKKAGDSIPKEMIRETNEQLQRIKKSSLPIPE